MTRNLTWCGWAGGAAALGLFALVCVSPGQDVPFAESFEDRAEGVLHGQNKWRAQRSNAAQVQAGSGFAGTRAAVVAAGATVWRETSTPSGTNVWIDFHARCAYPADSTPPALAGGVAAAFFVGADGRLRAVSHDTWVALDYIVPADAWRRFSVNLDYPAARWSLYVAGDEPGALAAAVATGLAFSASSTNTGFCRFRIRN